MANFTDLNVRLALVVLFQKGKMDRELTAKSQGFEYLHRKCRCKMLIGGG